MPESLSVPAQRPAAAQEPGLASALSRANPFPGLRPYEEEDANWFFGRGGEINELLKRLRRLHFVAIVGASGSGKSSLVRAGVLPPIRDGYLDAEWRIAAFRPGERPIANLAEAMCVDVAELAGFTNILRSGSLGLVRALGGQARGGEGKVLILVDQFEELFQFARRTGDSAQEEVKEFLKLLLAAANSTEVDVYVVVTMRLEWLTECASYTGLAEAINQGIYLVPQMTRRQFQQAILGPLESAGGSITTALLDRMLNDLDNKTDQLPVMQHALMRIWNRAGAAEAFDAPYYEAVGTFSNCLSAHAEEVYGELDDRQKQVAELLFRNITQVYQNRKIRRPRPVSEILAVTRVGAAELAAVVQAFSRAGRSFLVTTEGALTPASIVDVSHEALIRQWVRLCGWVEDEADKQSRASRLEVDAAEWDRDRERFKASLYQGYRLQRAEELRPMLGESSTALAFLDESRRARLHSRILKRGSITLALVLVVGFIFALYWVRSQSSLAVAVAQAERQKAVAEAASLQAKKAQEFQDDLVKKIDAANGSATALAAISMDIRAKRVYVQYVSSDLALAKTVQDRLRKGGYSVPGLELVDPAKMPPQSQVRFFHPEDRAEADKIAGTVKPLVTGNVAAQSIANLGATVPVGQFEVWLTAASAAVVAGKVDQPVVPPTPGPRSVDPTPSVPAPAAAITLLSASPQTIRQGESATLSWQTENATEVEIIGIGNKEPNGSLVVTPKESTFYSFIAKNSGNHWDSKSIMVAVTAPLPPIPATVPVSVPGAVGGADSLAGVKEALTRYREALESESVDDLRKAWPSIGKGKQSEMKGIFDQFNAIRLNVSCRDEDIHVEGVTASANCRLAFTYTQKGKKLPEQVTSNLFRLKRLGGGWVVDGVQ